MHCYICEHSSSPGGTRYAIREAIGVCHQCGVGVCEHHAFKSEEAGSPLLCEECAKLTGKSSETGKKLETATSAA